MLPDRVSNPGPLTYESGALPIALRGPARSLRHEKPETESHRAEYYIIYNTTQTVRYTYEPAIAAMHGPRRF